MDVNLILDVIDVLGQLAGELIDQGAGLAETRLEQFKRRRIDRPGVGHDGDLDQPGAILAVGGKSSDQILEEIDGMGGRLFRFRGPVQSLAEPADLEVSPRGLALKPRVGFVALGKPLVESQDGSEQGGVIFRAGARRVTGWLAHQAGVQSRGLLRVARRRPRAARFFGDWWSGVETELRRRPAVGLFVRSSVAKEPWSRAHPAVIPARGRRQRVVVIGQLVEHLAEHLERESHVLVGPLESLLGAHIAGPPDDRRQEQRPGGRRHQGRRRLVAAAPSPEALESRGPPGPDRAVVEEAPQVFGERPGRGVSMARLAGDRFQDDRFQIARNGRVEHSRRRRLAFADLTQELAGAEVAEGSTLGDQLVESEPQAVNVVLRARLAAQRFRGEITQRADDVARTGQVVVARELG